MHRINRESIYEVLEHAGRAGLHVNLIALHLINRLTELFDSEPLDREEVKLKVNRILLAESKKKRGGMFAHLLNPKTGKPFKGRYRVRQRA